MAATRHRTDKSETKENLGTFTFLGLTHFCGKSRKNKRFIIGRTTESKRMRAKPAKIKIDLRRRMHRPVPETGSWLRKVVQGYDNYHSIPRNGQAMDKFTRAVLRNVVEKPAKA